ncbi:MAG: M23 family metallopeptidase [Ignavibacteriales bacterium]|nr:M23 family metallopeptidase [Ignavibacteriales bacterium]
MFRLNKHITFYFSDKRLQIREIKWFRTKLFSFVATTVTIGLLLILSINYIFNNFIGIGTSKTKALMKENQLLQQQLVLMERKMNELQSTVNQIADEGDRLRLMVDLPSLDKETRSAGTGGAIVESEFDISSDNTSLLLQSAHELMNRLQSEANVQKHSYEQVVKQSEFNKSYFASMPAIKPMPGFYSRQEFGIRIHPVLGIKKPHEGLDIVNDVGTPISATGDGTVQMVGHSGGGFGNVIVINHGFGYQSVYAHLSKILVREGQHIKRGDLIAKSGRTGLVSGPHLHYEVRRNGICQNPMDYFFDDVTVQEYRKQIAEEQSGSK